MSEDEKEQQEVKRSEEGEDILEVTDGIRKEKKRMKRSASWRILNGIFWLLSYG